MQHRKRTALIAGLFTITCLAQISMNTMSGISADAAGSYDMAVTVNLAGEKKAISPHIYGVNDSGDGSNLKNVTVDTVRQGGNRFTGYNWETNYSNAGEDWHNSSDTNIGDDTDGSGYAGRKLSATCQKNNIPYKMTTLQMAGYVSADKAGTVLDTEAAPSSRWKEVKFKKDTALTLEPDITDNYVYMDEYVNYLVKTLGDSTTSTGIQAYSLDNEPVLWNDTHPLLHSKEVSSKELISKSIELASVVKDIDPNAEVFGPAFWGMLPCVNGSNQASDKNNNTYTDPDYDAVKGNYTWFMDYYLEQMANAEKESGKRLLDVVDVHFYSQDCSTRLPEYRLREVCMMPPMWKTAGCNHISDSTSHSCRNYRNPLTSIIRAQKLPSLNITSQTSAMKKNPESFPVLPLQKPTLSAALQTTMFTLQPTGVLCPNAHMQLLPSTSTPTTMEKVLPLVIHW